MNLRRLLRVVPFLIPMTIVAIVVTVFVVRYPSYTWRQKSIVTVEIPGGETSESTVVQVHASLGPFPLSGTEVEYHLRGEATVVEVRPGQYLFVLLSESQNEWAARIWEKELPPHRRDWLARIGRLKGARTVPPKLYPLLVTFGDVADPTSVRRVDPADLAASFGPGIRLKSITLEITDEPVTEGRVEKVLVRDVFQLWALINSQALKRNGIRDPYFKTFASKLSRDQFVNR